MTRESLDWTGMWVVCGCLFELWLSCGHVYVTRTVYKHSDITYLTILKRILSEKVTI